jgi:beta-N-acetylhexosaminidase
MDAEGAGDIVRQFRTWFNDEAKGYAMCGKRRVAQSLLILGTAILALAAAVPAEAAPRETGAATATSGPPIESSKSTLGDTSVDEPALWTSNPSGAKPALASVLAWIGTDSGHSLNLMPSGDGITYYDTQKVTFAESSNDRPAVVVQASTSIVIVAWTGTDPNHTLNLLCHGGTCGTERKLTIWSDTSFTSPALVSFGSGFLLAWAGNDSNHSLNLLPFTLTASGSGFQLNSKTTLRQFGSVAAPSLALNPQNNQLLLSWAASSPAQQLDFATSANGMAWSAAQTSLGETSAVGPSGYAVAASGMPGYWMAWTGTDPAHTLNVRDTSSFPAWPLSGNKTTLDENALGGPALGYVGNVGRILLAWTGTDPAHHMNLATVTTIPLDQRIDAYIATLSTTQLVGQTVVMSVCTNGYDANLNQALTQWDVSNAIIYTSCNGGPTEPPTAAGLQQLDRAMQSHANRAGSLLLAIDEEGGTVDRLAPYYGSTPGARQLAQTGNPQNAYAQAQTDAARMLNLGLNVDFAPVVDVDQGGGEGPSRMFGTTVGTVTTYAGAFLDGLQQHGVAGTLKHWPGIGAATGNPDNTLPTINSSQAQMQAIDFPPFRNLLSHQPGMIMVTTVMVPAYDNQAPADLSSELVTTVLRGQLGYQGVIVTDALGAQGILIYMQQHGYPNPTQAIAEASVRAFLAGNDLLLCPLGQDRLSAVVTAMTNAVQSGRISQTQLKASVHRIIRLRVNQGLMSLP